MEPSDWDALALKAKQVGIDPSALLRGETPATGFTGEVLPTPAQVAKQAEDDFAAFRAMPEAELQRVLRADCQPELDRENAAWRYRKEKEEREYTERVARVDAELEGYRDSNWLAAKNEGEG